MFKVNSERAQKILKEPSFMRREALPGMRKYEGNAFSLQVHMELESTNVKNLSYAGDLPSEVILVLESMASLLIGKNLSLLNELSIRECEAFLRDRNSQLAFEEMDEKYEKGLKDFFLWLRNYPLRDAPREYHFHSAKGPFHSLTLVDKVRELKAFLNSPEVLSLYTGCTPPELVDVEEVTAYIQAPYETERDRSRFEKLHLLGVDTFQEENLNFIPEP